MVALDGHRIAIREIALKDPSEEHQVVIAGKTLNEISKILSSDTEKEVHIYITEKHVVFEFDQTVVVSRLMEGKYYNIDSMLSSQYSTTVNMNRKELLDSIDRGMLLIKEDDKKPIIIMVSESSMKCKINTTIGSMDETIDIQKSGENINIGFNPKFLIDALRAIEDEEVTLYMVSPKAPCFIRSKEGAEEKYCYLILPVNFVTID